MAYSYRLRWIGALIATVVVFYAAAVIVWQKPVWLVPEACLNKLDLSARLLSPARYIVSYITPVGAVCAWQPEQAVAAAAHDPDAAAREGRVVVQHYFAAHPHAAGLAGAQAGTLVDVAWNCTASPDRCPVPDRPKPPATPASMSASRIDQSSPALSGLGGEGGGAR